MWAKNIRFGSFQLSLRTVCYLMLGAACTTPLVGAPAALFMGLLFAQYAGNPFPVTTKKISAGLLQYSVAALGLGINVSTAVQVGRDGFAVTLFSIAATLGLGWILGKTLKINPECSLLIGAGTAICGGSAIAAVAKSIQAKPTEISIALASVFLLNALALFLFPFVGCVLNLSQTQFGWWAALAIHDTSSVVGAASQYGAEALELATTIKLVRALWIIPVALIAGVALRKAGTGIKIPWFIGIFVLAMLAGSYLHFLQPAIPAVSLLARSGLTLSMFLIGSLASLNIFSLAGSKPFALGLLLWVLVSVISLGAVMAYFPSNPGICGAG